MFPKEETKQKWSLCNFRNSQSRGSQKDMVLALRFIHVGFLFGKLGTIMSKDLSFSNPRHLEYIIEHLDQNPLTLAIIHMNNMYTYACLSEGLPVLGARHDIVELLMYSSNVRAYCNFSLRMSYGSIFATLWTLKNMYLSQA